MITSEQQTDAEASSRTSSEVEDCCEYFERGVFHDFADRATGDDNIEEAEDGSEDWPDELQSD